MADCDVKTTKTDSIKLRELNEALQPQSEALDIMSNKSNDIFWRRPSSPLEMILEVTSPFEELNADPHGLEGHHRV